MAKLEGKLPFVGAVYQHRELGFKMQVLNRERGNTVIRYRREKTGGQGTCDADTFYDEFKRCKEGTAFHIEEGWNE